MTKLTLHFLIARSAYCYLLFIATISAGVTIFYAWELA